MDLDETEQRLHAEFHQCANERAVAEDKITNPATVCSMQVGWRFGRQPMRFVTGAIKSA
jgi:hypothetical protein